MINNSQEYDEEEEEEWYKGGWGLNSKHNFGCHTFCLGSNSTEQELKEFGSFSTKGINNNCGIVGLRDCGTVGFSVPQTNKKAGKSTEQGKVLS